MDWFWKFFLGLILAFRSDLCLSTNLVEVSTRLGRVIGRATEVNIEKKTKIVNEFLGIPFAKAPLGRLRFQRPEKTDTFRDDVNATTFGAICPQSGIQIVSLDKFKISEDCLFLNIFAPQVNSGAEKLAVMVYIHGGNFITGASDFYVGDVMSAYGNVIIVTFNYRLSIFGFLTTHDNKAKGNFGLWDQQLAIQWVHENIASFHGDPNKVTLFGQSAGAVSAIYQALYPGNEGLFQRVIAESGTPISFGVSMLNPAFTNLRYSLIGQLTGCPFITSNGILECLREKRVTDILASVERMFQQVSFEPVIDGEFILADPQDILAVNSSHPTSKKMFASVDLLIGGNSMEGASYLQFMWRTLLSVQDVENFPISQRQFKETIVPKVLQQIYGKDVVKHAADAVNIRYTDVINPRDPATIRDMLLKLSTDYGFRIPNLKTARLHENLGPSKTYVYEFKAHPTFTIGRFGRPGWVTEANHGDEVIFVFGFSRRMLASLDITDTFRPTEEEISLSRTVMRAWTNFAKNGDPSQGDPDDDVILWPEFTNFETAFMEIGINASSYEAPQVGYGEPGGSFWLEFMPDIMAEAEKSYRPDVTCDDVIKDSRNVNINQVDIQDGISFVKNNICSLGLVGLSVCIVVLSCSLVTVCYYFIRKKKSPTKYDAVEV